MIIARVESLILGKSVNDALKRADLYIKNGVDGIMIHTAKSNPAKIYLNFQKNLKKLH